MIGNCKNFKGLTVRFNLMNFTKRESLYPCGMKIVIHRPGQKPKKGGLDIVYS